MSTSMLITLIVIDLITILIIAAVLRGLWETRHTVIDYAELHAPIGKSRNFVRRPVFMRRNDAVTTEKYDLRVLFFSDLHAEYCQFTSSQLENVIRTEHKRKRLDAVLFGGDIVNDPLKSSVGVKYLAHISSVCSELDIPFLGVTGNHDVMIPAEDIEACGFKDIRRSYVTLPSRLGDGQIAICGVPDTGRENRVWFAPSPVPHETEDGSPVIANVLLGHNPDYILHLDELFLDGAIVAPKTLEYDAEAVEGAKARAVELHESKRPEYMLAGHIHGGQIRTPIGIEFSLLRKDILPKKQKVIAGVYEGCGVSLFLSRGVGNILLPLRIGARPEVTVVEIYAR